MKSKILESKDWIEEPGCFPTRIVLLEIEDAGTKYSTHKHCKKEDGSTYLYGGHYINDLEEAKKDFEEREV